MWGRLQMIENYSLISMVLGGWGGIRTHGTVPRTLVFKTRALNHSATHPGRSPDTTALGDFKPKSSTILQVRPNLGPEFGFTGN